MNPPSDGVRPSPTGGPCSAGTACLYVRRPELRGFPLDSGLLEEKHGSQRKSERVRESQGESVPCAVLCRHLSTTMSSSFFTIVTGLPRASSSRRAAETGSYAAMKRRTCSAIVRTLMGFPSTAE